MLKIERSNWPATNPDDARIKTNAQCQNRTHRRAIRARLARGLELLPIEDHCLPGTHIFSEALLSDHKSLLVKSISLSRMMVLS